MKSFTKRIFLLLFVLVSLKVISQPVDSAWMLNDYLPRFYKDTGTYLPKVPLYTQRGRCVILNDYKGKLIYLDFWASWCGNCIIRFPYADQLRKRLAVLGLDTVIQFLYINVDNTKEARLRAMKKYHPEGINLYTGDTTIFTAWQIDAIPRYMLLDISGKVLAKEMASPDDASVDYILYAASKGVDPVQALWKRFGQEKLRELHQDTADMTDKDYREWYNKTLPSLFAFYEWRTGHEKQSNSK